MYTMWGGYVGQPTLQSDNEIAEGTFNAEINPASNFTHFALTAAGLTAVDAEGGLWANDYYNSDSFGVNWGSLPYASQAGDTLTLVAAGAQKVFGTTLIRGAHVLGATGELFYTGEHFTGCGVVLPVGSGWYLPNLAKLSGPADWADLASVSCAGGYSKAFFNFENGDTRVAGENDTGIFWTLDDVTYEEPILVESTPPSVGMYSDGWHTGQFFLTSSGDLYSWWYDFPPEIKTSLFSTDVKTVWGGASNWFMVYSKTDKSVWGRGISSYEPEYLIHQGPAKHVHVDGSWGVVSVALEDGRVDVWEDGSPLREDFFPGQVIAMVASSRGLVVGLTGGTSTAHEAPKFWQDLDGTEEAP